MREISETEKRVRRALWSVIGAYVPEEEVLQAERLDDLFGVDSLVIIEFITAIEKEFHIRLDSEELTYECIRDLGRLSQYLDSRLGAGRF